MDMKAAGSVRQQVDPDLEGGHGPGHGIEDSARIAHSDHRRNYFNANWIMTM